MARAHETAVVTGDVKIGAESNIWYGCVMRGDVNKIRIGKGVNIQDGTIVHVSRLYACIIEDYVSIGHMALIHACTLEQGCFVGMKACIMDGAVVEKGAFVAAGALVTPGKRVPAGELWAGQPARFVRKISEKDQAILDYTQPNYVKLGQTYLAVEGEGLSQRIQNLEEMLAHKDSETQDLSDMVNQQWKRIEAMENELNRTKDRVITLEDDVGQGPEADQKPPHW